MTFKKKYLISLFRNNEINRTGEPIKTVIIRWKRALLIIIVMLTMVINFVAFPMGG